MARLNLRRGSMLKRPKDRWLRYYQDLDRGEIMTVREVLQNYWNHRGLASSTRDNWRSRISALDYHLGHLVVADLDANVLFAYVKNRERGSEVIPAFGQSTTFRLRKGTPSSHNAELKGVLVGAVDFAIRCGLIEPKYKLMFYLKYDTPGARERWLRREEAAAIIAKAKADREKKFPNKARRVYMFLVLALFTGARRNAIMDLTWDRVDFENNTVDFRTKTKTTKRRVIVQMMPELRAILLEERQAEHTRGQTYVTGNRRSGSISADVREFLDKLKLYDVTPHTFRHTWATWATQDGVPPKLICEYLGMTMNTYESTYAHHDPARYGPAVNRTLLPRPDVLAGPHPTEA